nr:hypothetical protein CFP56_39841 [Quercus suber]
MLAKIPILSPYNLVHTKKSINFGTLPKNVLTPQSKPSPIHNPGDPPLTQLPTVHPTLKSESVKLGPNFESINFGMLPKNVPTPSGPSLIHNPSDPPSTSLSIVHPTLRSKSIKLGPNFESINFGILSINVHIPPSGPSGGG